eukprot:365759-Chlamydomonas_euryale.AAC.10
MLGTVSRLTPGLSSLDICAWACLIARWCEALRACLGYGHAGLHACWDTVMLGYMHVCWVAFMRACMLSCSQARMHEADAERSRVMDPLNPQP